MLGGCTGPALERCEFLTRFLGKQKVGDAYGKLSLLGERLRGGVVVGKFMASASCVDDTSKAEPVGESDGNCAMVAYRIAGFGAAMRSPVGSPFASFSYFPPGGAGVFRSIPSAVSPALLRKPRLYR